MFFVYAIKSKVDGRIYVGLTQDVEKRLKEHNNGRMKSTKGFRPWDLIFIEEQPDRETARQREKYWKSGCGKEALKQLPL